MKKIFTLFIAVITFGIAAQAQVTCNVDNADTAIGISPRDSVAPHIVRAVAFDTVGQIYVPAQVSVTYQGFPVTATVVWLNFDSVTGFPGGINYALPTGASDTIYGGNRQCFVLSGTTLDPVGDYPLTFWGHIRLQVLTYDTTITIAMLNQASQAAGGPSFTYTLHVDGGVGIHDVGQNFNSSLNVYPNPTSGKFDLTLSNIGDVNGEISVYDMTGRKVFTQKAEASGFYRTTIDLSSFAKGLYTVQVRTANGSASKNISVE